MKNVLPRKEVPNLRVETTSGMKWDLREQNSENFTMVVFYRGLHCPVCKSYLQELNEKVEKFEEKGVNIICISANNKELAEKTVEEWNVDNLTIGYGLETADSRKWDLYVSEGINDNEPEVFFEPALFLIKPDNMLYAASIQTMPFARPKFDELLKAIDFVLEKDYPARGEA
ncbi:Alkyl hydroperoxide reductase subunit AhpC (peroxiredoxin) [Salegentibacter echinorum]|uniref:Alkyl hydroperoxide reductase subunit AhpC (Peroxiredoxin) n=1 Tax=Salegentibacter echinorum TaxID=1073325 RepID=A0A1M5CWV1_SALEC|nr:redoxin domain-containing protein [Salegentibacter echinorum]SHF59184.1 Alkyl hydroperoxide reductase subunit AhpC (peroxiredoxin) [Salegentibacter echinorum]